MTEEENKAIEDLRKILFQTIQANECSLSTNDFKDEIKTYTDILNLIEKLQKEINGAIDYVEVNAVYEDEDEKCTRYLDNIECNELLDILKGKYKY